MAYTVARSDAPRGADGKVIFDKVPLSETWAAMEALVDAGLVRNIGVANFGSQLLNDLLSYARYVELALLHANLYCVPVLPVQFYYRNHACVGCLNYYRVQLIK